MIVSMGAVRCGICLKHAWLSRKNLCLIFSVFEVDSRAPHLENALIGLKRGAEEGFLVFALLSAGGWAEAQAAR